MTEKNPKQLKCQLYGILYKAQSEPDYNFDHFGDNPYHQKERREYEKYDDIVRYKHNSVYKKLMVSRTVPLVKLIKNFDICKF